MLLVGGIPRDRTPGHGADSEAQRARARDGRDPHASAISCAAETTRLNDMRTRLRGLMEEQEAYARPSASRSSKSVRTAAADISRNVSDLNDLIAKLDQAVKENTGFGAYETSSARQAAAGQHYAEFISADVAASRRTRPRRCRRSRRRRDRRAHRRLCRRQRPKGQRFVELAPGRYARQPGPDQACHRLFRCQGQAADAGPGPPGVGLWRENAIWRPIQGYCARDATWRPSHVTMRWLDCLRWRISQLWPTLDHQCGRRLSCAACWPVADRRPARSVRPRRRAGRNHERLGATGSTARLRNNAARPLR